MWLWPSQGDGTGVSLWLWLTFPYFLRMFTIFWCVCCSLAYLLWKVGYSGPLPILYLSTFWVMSMHHIFWMLDVYQINSSKRFYSVNFLLVISIMSWCINVLTLKKSKLFLFSPWLRILVSYLRIYIYIYMLNIESLGFIPMFPSKYFSSYI